MQKRKKGEEERKRRDLEEKRRIGRGEMLRRRQRDCLRCSQSWMRKRQREGEGLRRRD